MRSSFPRDLFSLWLVAASAVCLGILVNQFRDKPLPLVYQSKAERLESSVSRLAGMEPSKMVATPGSSLQEISLDSFRAFAKEKRGLILDARPEIFYRFGHVPGALSLPRDEFEKGYLRLKAKLAAHKGRPMIIYCADVSCEDSGLVYQALAKLGYPQISIFRGGWDAWTKAGLPEEKQNEEIAE